jgi:hypothetical protein
MNLSPVSNTGTTIHDYQDFPMNPPMIPETSHEKHTTYEFHQHNRTIPPDARGTLPNIFPKQAMQFIPPDAKNATAFPPMVSHSLPKRRKPQVLPLKPENNKIELLPIFIQEYVKTLYNVEPDGHCGFRAAGICLGMGEEGYMEIRKRLIEEIQSRRAFYQMDPTIDHVDNMIRALTVTRSGRCNKVKWMSMPSMASPLANAFETAVFFFSPEACYTAFPEFCPPVIKPAIIIALMGEHFYAVEMKNPDVFPAPRIARNIFLPPSNQCQAWRQRYHECFWLMDNITQGGDPVHLDLT